VPCRFFETQRRDYAADWNDMSSYPEHLNDAATRKAADEFSSANGQLFFSSGPIPESDAMSAETRLLSMLQQRNELRKGTADPAKRFNQFVESTGSKL
jgi:hypothetical protein